MRWVFILFFSGLAVTSGFLLVSEVISLSGRAGSLGWVERLSFVHAAVVTTFLGSLLAAYRLTVGLKDPNDHRLRSWSAIGQNALTINVVFASALIGLLYLALNGAASSQG